MAIVAVLGRFACLYSETAVQTQQCDRAETAALGLPEAT